MARAQAYTVKPTVSVMVGYTYSRLIGYYPVDDPLAQSGPSIGPSFSLNTTADTPISRSRATVLASSILPFNNNLAFAPKRFNFHLQVNSTTDVDLDPVTDLKVILNAGVTPVNIFSGVIVDPAQAQLDAAPTGVTYMITSNAEETIKRQLSKTTTVSESVVLRYNAPYNPQAPPPTSMILMPSVTGSTTYDVNTFTVTPGTQIIRFGAGITRRGFADTHYQYVNSLGTSWARPLYKSLRGSVNIGLNQTISPGSSAGLGLSGKGGLKLDMDVGPAHLGLSYSHDAMVNGLTGQINVHDQAAINFTAPVGATGQLTTTNLSFTHVEPIAGDGTTTGNLSDTVRLRFALPIASLGIAPSLAAAYAIIRPETGIGLGAFGAGYRQWTGDASIGYSPERYRQIAFSLRTQLAWKQPLDNPTNETLRYSIIGGVTFTWPNQTEHAAAFQVRVAPAYTPEPTLSSEPNPALGEGASDFVDPRSLTKPGQVDADPDPGPAPAPPESP